MSRYVWVSSPKKESSNPPSIAETNRLECVRLPTYWRERDLLEEVSCCHTISNPACRKSGCSDNFVGSCSSFKVRALSAEE